MGKNAARREAAKVCHKTLRPCPEESVDWNTTENLYIEGDNLEVLKLLQKSYLGKVKMIYIDPPYNTGNDFVYFDSFKIEDQDYELSAGNIDEQGNRLRKNTDTNARFHSDWCSMIYERLLVARSLLTEDGVIFISIDDNEQKNLKNVCDEVLGSNNFVAQLIWEKKYTVANDAKYFSDNHDYILCYAKSKPNFVIGKLPRTEQMNAAYKNPDNHPKGPWKATPLHARSGSASSESFSYTFKNGVIFIPPTGRFSAYSEETLKMMDENDEIWFGKDGKSVPSRKTFLCDLKNEGTVPRTIIPYTEGGHNHEADEEMKGMMKKKVFTSPKPTKLLHRLLTVANLNKSSIILDFFSGSATTAHAVMQLNAEDGGKRKFIMVQLPEETEEKSEARKAGYANICEIGKERIRRAGKKIKEDNADKPGIENLDTGFRVFKCEESFMNEVYFNPAELEQDALFKHVDNVKPGTTDMQLLFGCMLDWGVQLSLPLTDFEVEGKTIYNVNDGDLVACFAHDINEAVIAAIAELQPLRVVFRDSCFSEAALKMNLFELFKQRCGWSEEQVQSRVHVI